MNRRAPFLICLAIGLGVFAGCASSTVRNQDVAEIRITDTLVGGNLEVSPSLLRIKPGQKVTWANSTNFDIQIQFDSEKVESISERPFLIRSLSTAQGKFEAPGTYSYTLVFSSSKTFGRMTGTILVEDSNPQNKPFQQEAPESSPEETPDHEPYII